MTLPYCLRPATEDDYEWLKQLHHVTMRESVEAIWGWDEAFQDDRFREMFDPSDQQIVEIAGRAVGVMAVQERPSEMFLSNIQIAPTEQGNGIGTALVHGLQCRAAATGGIVTLQVNRANRARALYERLGFAVTGTTETHYIMTWSRGRR